MSEEFEISNEIEKLSERYYDLFTENITDRGLTLAEAKEATRIFIQSEHKDLLIDPYNEENCDNTFANRFWGTNNTVVNKIKLKYDLEDKFPNYTEMKMMDRFRKLAMLGFIPYATYLRPTLQTGMTANEDRDFVSSLLPYLKKDGFDFKKDVYGFITTKVPCKLQKPSEQESPIPENLAVEKPTSPQFYLTRENIQVLEKALEKKIFKNIDEIYKKRIQKMEGILNEILDLLK
jgi:hypothetical protein